MAKKKNPIALKLQRLIDSGQTTKEKICVASDLKYPTLENVFFRSTVSYMTLKSLKIADIINDKDVRGYDEWVRNNIAPPKKPKKKPVVIDKKKTILLEDEDVEEKSKGFDGPSEEQDGLIEQDDL